MLRRSVHVVRGAGAMLRTALVAVSGRISGPRAEFQSVHTTRGNFEEASAFFARDAALQSGEKGSPVSAEAWTSSNISSTMDHKDAEAAEGEAASSEDSDADAERRTFESLPSSPPPVRRPVAFHAIVPADAALIDRRAVTARGRSRPAALPAHMN